MKISFSLLFFIAFSYLAYAGSGDAYYYADNVRLNLKKEPGVLVVHFNPEYSSKLGSLSLPDAIEIELHEVYGRCIVTFSRPYTAADVERISTMLGAENIYSAIEAYRLEDGFMMTLTHEVVAEFKNLNDISREEMRNLMFFHGAEYSRDEYGVSVFRVSDPLQGLAFANELHEKGHALWAHPDFYAKVTRYNDPLYPQQFQMNNTGQVVNGWAGVPGMDCNAPAAWSITTGLSTTVVAVIDDGLEAHEDLVDASNASRVLGGHTPATGGNGTPRYSSDAHGMACAGIVAATHSNAKGVRGLAPEVKLRSVNIFWGGETTQTIANGINWARTQGVDIMSNSWGYTSCTVSYTNINNALANARTQGRGGKGCIVVFASGNGGKSCIDYPANRPDVIAVGAFTSLGAHATYANRGPQLGLVAASDPNPGQAGGLVRTIDRMGSAGYNSTNYTSNFGGTSAACPVVAGVAALMLAVDNNLTEAQVRNTMYSTAVDMGTAGFDNTFGHGRVNAGAAVNAVVPPPPPPPVCSDNEATLTILFDNYPGETSWTITTIAGDPISSGGSYGNQPNGSTLDIPICLETGCYILNFFDSVGDGMCCASGNGGYTLITGNEILVSGGIFSFSTSNLFCVGEEEEEEPASCTPVNFNNYSLLAYGGSGLDVGLAQVLDGGSTLYQQNNSLKAILLNYPVSPNTILEFEFRCSQQAQMHGIGFHNNNQINPNRIFKIFGTQNLNAITDFATYSGNQFMQFSIPVGQYYFGSNLTRLFFLTGNYTGNPRGISEWKNVRVYEAGDCTPALVIPGFSTGMEEASAALYNHFSSPGADVYPNPACDVIFIQPSEGEAVFSYRIYNTAGIALRNEVVQSYPVQIDVNNLASGIYMLEWENADGVLSRNKVMIAR